MPGTYYPSAAIRARLWATTGKKYISFAELKEHEGDADRATVLDYFKEFYIIVVHRIRISGHL
jgi:hypothetical protein